MDHRRCEPIKRLVYVVLVAAAGVFALAGSNATAEPYIAVQEGLQCSACHSNPAGGGRRNAFGNAYAQTQLASSRLGDSDLWTGEINKWLSTGGDLRASFEAIDTPGAESTSEFRVNRGNLYVEATIIPDRLSIYIDQQIAPDASQNREAYVRLNSKNGNWMASAGQFYLPYGLRLQDDTAFVRLATSINFTNPDRGIQVGYTSGAWSTIAAVTNGSGGGQEIDSGKQISLVSSYVRAKWRAGLSASSNNADAGDRNMIGAFIGLLTGRIAWLAEVDRVSDDISPGVTTDAVAALVEANWSPRQGHNLKFSYEYLDTDDNLSEDHQVRYSVVWEYSPMQFLQSRLGLRTYEGPPGIPQQNRDVMFAEIHGFF